MTELGSEHMAVDELQDRRPDLGSAAVEVTAERTYGPPTAVAGQTGPMLLDQTRKALFEARAAARYWWISPLARGRRVLDAGCGSGIGSAVLAREEASEVIGVDRAAAVLELARSWRIPANLKLQCDEIERLPFPDRSFDLVVCYDVIDRQEDVKSITDHLLRVLAPDGALIMSYDQSSLADEARSMLRRRLAHVCGFRQYDLLTTAIVDDETAELADHAAVDGMAIRKAAHCEPGTETEIIVMGTDSLANLPRMAAVFSSGQDVHQWVRQAEAHELATKELRGVIRELRGMLGERDRLRTELWKTEQMLAMRVSRYEEGVEAASLRTALDYQGTFSWQVTGPLRTAGGRMKRMIRSRLKALRSI